jgi:predicted DNA-binding ArsR family transcriptional regulator
MIFNFTSSPIIIVANYRTGSTALLDHIRNSTGLRAFSEPCLRIEDPDRSADVYRIIDNQKNDLEYEFVTEYLAKGRTDYCLKFIAHDWCKHGIYVACMEAPGYKIRLYRENKIKQIASFYIAHMTSIWHQSNQKEFLRVRAEYLNSINEIANRWTENSAYIDSYESWDEFFNKDQLEMQQDNGKIINLFKKLQLHDLYNRSAMLMSANVEIDEQMLKQCIRNIAHTDMRLKYSETEFNLTISYEQLGNISDTIFEKNAAVANQADIEDWIANWLQSHAGLDDVFNLDDCWFKP